MASGLKEMALGLGKECLLYAETEYIQACQDLFSDCPSVHVGLVNTYLPLIPSTIRVEHESEPLLGYHFNTEVVKGEHPLIFVGSNQRLWQYIVPNVGLDHPIHHFDPS